MRVIRENAVLGLTAIFFFLLGFTSGYSDTPRFDTFKDNQFKVTGVYDGARFKAEGHGLTIRVQLVGLNAPQRPRSNDQPGQPHGLEATRFLSGLIGGKIVDIVGHGLSRNNLILAEVYLEEENINLTMLEAGLARVSKEKLPMTIKTAQYMKMEEEARKAGKGIWGVDN